MHDVAMRMYMHILTLIVGVLGSSLHIPLALALHDVKTPEEQHPNKKM